MAGKPCCCAADDDDCNLICFYRREKEREGEREREGRTKHLFYSLPARALSSSGLEGGLINR